MTQQRTVCILSVSGGAGHVQAALALVAAGSRFFPRYNYVHIDLLTLAGKDVRNLYDTIYQGFIHNNADAWFRAYAAMGNKTKPVTLDDPRGLVAALAAPELVRRLVALQPVAYICTHYLAAQVLTELGAKTSLVCTDFGVNPWWAACGADSFFVACTEAQTQLVSLGIDAGRVHVLGIPVGAGFVKIPDQQTCRQALMLAAGPTVLLLGGGTGQNTLAEKASNLARQTSWQIVAVAGKNAQLYKNLQSLQTRTKNQVRAFGFTKSIPFLLRAADVVWMKPGGLSTAEALAVGTCLVVDQPIAAQELYNVSFLRKHEAASVVYNTPGGTARVLDLFLKPLERQTYQQRTAGLGRPNAARDILQQVHRRLDMPGP